VAVSLLRNVLRWQAALWALAGLGLAVAPGSLVEGLLNQEPMREAAWLRILGVLAIVVAAQMILVTRKLEELWWWSWSFVVLEAGVAAVATLNAAFGVAEGAAVWPWWALAVASWGFMLLDLAALAKAGTERTPV
jgi:hypothetical protein